MDKKYLLEICSEKAIDKEEIRKTLKEKFIVEYIGLLDVDD